MSYMATLRPDKAFIEANENKKGRTSQQGFIDNPPSFYEEDLKKWKQKFEQSIESRRLFKKNLLAKEERSFLATNSNFFGKDPDAKLSETRYTGGTIQPKTSEFKKVTLRRKSR